VTSVLSLVLSTLAQQGLEAPGPFAVDVQTGLTFTLPSAEVAGELYWPVAPSAPAPPVVVAHGFARNAAAVAGWGAHLASHGFVVVVPDLPTPFSPDHALNAQIMEELLDWVRASPPGGLTIDPSRGAFVGHSAGGLASFLAAAGSGATAVVALDAVDAQGAGVAAAAGIGAPVLVIAAEPAQCNGSGSASVLYAALSSPGSWYVRVVAATHCDGEDPSNGTCVAFCGGEDPARRALFRRYATAHLLATFGCAALDHLPGGTALAADVSAGTIADVRQVGALCTAVADAGIDGGPIDQGTDDAAPGDAEAVDAGSPADAALGSDAALGMDGGTDDASVGGDAAAADAPDRGSVSRSDERRQEGCRCSVSAPVADPHGWSVLVIASWLARRCRRRPAA
jgi:dienelactone hydrolase